MQIGKYILFLQFKVPYGKDDFTSILLKSISHPNYEDGFVIRGHILRERKNFVSQVFKFLERLLNHYKNYLQMTYLCGDNRFQVLLSIYERL